MLQMLMQPSLEGLSMEQPGSGMITNCQQQYAADILGISSMLPSESTLTCSMVNNAMLDKKLLLFIWTILISCIHLPPCLRRHGCVIGLGICLTR